MLAVYAVPSPLPARLPACHSIDEFPLLCFVDLNRGFLCLRVQGMASRPVEPGPDVLHERSAPGHILCTRAKVGCWQALATANWIIWVGNLAFPLTVVHSLACIAMQAGPACRAAASAAGPGGRQPAKAHARPPVQKYAGWWPNALCCRPLQRAIVHPVVR